MGTVRQLRTQDGEAMVAMVKRLFALLDEVIDKDPNAYALARQHLIDHFGPPETDRLERVKTVKQMLEGVAAALEKLGPLTRGCGRLADELAAPRTRTGTVHLPSGPVTMTITDEKA